METTELRANPIKELKSRVAAIADKLPRNYRKVIYQHHPKYNTPVGRRLIANVVDGKSSDSALTEILEQIESRVLI